MTITEPLSPSSPVSLTHDRTGGRWPLRERIGIRRMSLVWMVGATLVLLAINVWWLHRFRVGYPLNIDEAAYLNMGFVDAAGLQNGGLTGLWHAFMSSHLQAPLAPLLTVPFHAVLGWRLADGFALSLSMWVALMWLTYGIALRLTTPGWAAFAGLIIGTTPGITNDARNFLFALPLSVMLTAAVWALMRSDGLHRTGWCVLAGIFLGCAPLSRTMGLAFLPGPLVAAAIQAAWLPGRRRRLLNLAVMVAAGVAVGYPWLHANFSNVLHYLQPPTGVSTPGIGHQQRALWEVAAHDLVLRELFVPLAAGLLACFVVAAVNARRAVGALRHPRRIKFLDWAHQVPQWGALIPFATLLAGWLALSVNVPSLGQWIPLIPSLVVLAVAALATIRWAAAKWTILVYLCAIMILNAISQTDTLGLISHTRSVYVPVLGTSPIINGNSSLRTLMESAQEPKGNIVEPLPAVDREWMPLSRSEAGYILNFAAAHHEPALVTFASRDPLFNTNTLQLAGELWFHQLLSMGQLISNNGHNSVAAYRTELGGVPPGVLGIMISVDNGPGGYQPPVDQKFAQKAAMSLGYVEVHQFVLPDGRRGRVWWRKT